MRSKVMNINSKSKRIWFKRVLFIEIDIIVLRLLVMSCIIKRVNDLHDI